MDYTAAQILPVLATLPDPRPLLNDPTIRLSLTRILSKMGANGRDSAGYKNLYSILMDSVDDDEELSLPPKKRKRHIIVDSDTEDEEDVFFTPSSSPTSASRRPVSATEMGGFVFNLLDNRNLDHDGIHADFVLHHGKVPELAYDLKSTMITKEPQHRKSFILIHIFLLYISAGISCVFICPDVQVLNQFIERFREEAAKIVHHFVGEERARLTEILYWHCKKPFDGANDAQRLRDALDGSRPRLIACNKTYQQLMVIRTALDDIYHPIRDHFVLCIDECHAAGGISKDAAQSDLKYINQGKRGVKYDDQVNFLRSRAKKLFCCSATPQSSLYALGYKYVIVPPTDTAYRGFAMIDWITPMMTASSRPKRGKKSALVVDVMKVIHELAVKSPISRLGSGLHPQIPIMCLIKHRDYLELASMNKLHREIAYTEVPDLKDKFAFITFTGDYVDVSHHALPDILLINGKRSTLDDGGKVHRLRDVSIQDVLTHLGSFGVDIIQRILVLFYDMGGMGISFTTQYNSNLNWHATDMILDIPDTMNDENLCQIVGRCHGMHNDDVRVNVRATLVVKKRFLNAVMKTRDILDSYLSLAEPQSTKKFLREKLHLKGTLNRTYYKKELKLKSREVSNPQMKRREDILRNGTNSAVIANSLAPEFFKDEVEVALRLRPEESVTPPESPSETVPGNNDDDDDLYHEGDNIDTEAERVRRVDTFDNNDTSCTIQAVSKDSLSISTQVEWMKLVAQLEHYSCSWLPLSSLISRAECKRHWRWLRTCGVTCYDESVPNVILTKKDDGKLWIRFNDV